MRTDLALFNTIEPLVCIQSVIPLVPKAKGCRTAKTLKGFKGPRRMKRCFKYWNHASNVLPPLPFHLFQTPTTLSDPFFHRRSYCLIFLFFVKAPCASDVYSLPRVFVQTYFYRATRKRFKLHHSYDLHCLGTTADITESSLVSIADYTSPLLCWSITLKTQPRLWGKSICIELSGNRRESWHQISSLECAVHQLRGASKTLHIVIEVLPKVLKN